MYLCGVLLTHNFISMKKVLVSAFAALCAFGAFAQVSFWDSEAAAKKLFFAPRVGLNVSNMSFDIPDGDVEGKKAKIGFNVGVGVDYMINRSFGINTGLFYTTKGVKFEEKDEGYKDTQTYNAGYLQLPVYASYRLNFAENSQLQVNFGPYFAYGINGKVTDKYVDYEDPDYSEEYKYDLFGTSDDDKDRTGIKRFDLGLGVGVGYTFKRVHLGLEYQFGLLNCLEKDEWGSDYKAYTRNLSISVGYTF